MAQSVHSPLYIHSLLPVTARGHTVTVRPFIKVVLVSTPLPLFTEKYDNTEQDHLNDNSTERPESSQGILHSQDGLRHVAVFGGSAIMNLLDLVLQNGLADENHSVGDIRVPDGED